MSLEAKRASLARRLEENSTLIPFCGCRIWLGATNEHGYGLIGSGRDTPRRAHRVAYELEFGSIPEGEGYHGMVVRHTCDVPACINPHHMRLGTQQDNLEDTRTRNRLRFGSKHHGAKLNEADVAEILKKKGNKTQAEIAAAYGVSSTVVSRIFSGNAWARATKGEILSAS